MAEGKLFLGIDIGSVSIKTAVLDESRSLRSDTYTRIKGDPRGALAEALAALASRFPGNRIAAAAITGSGGKKAAASIGALFVNEILAQAAFAHSFHPAARTIIEMGGEDAKLIVPGTERDGSPKIEDFSMNAACAAGFALTRAFLTFCQTRTGS